MKGSRYVVDLHTHSIISYDGGITASQYEKILQSGEIDCIAITDHNETSFARIMQKKLGEKIIIGEEITTIEGEIIGLYLKETIPSGISLDEAIASIKHQGGLIYLPHPYERIRKGLGYNTVERIAQDIDIIEVFNGRGRFRGKAELAQKFAIKNNLPQAAGSDAHGFRGLGYTTTVISAFPSQKTLTKLISEAILDKTYAPFYTYFYPIMNKIKNSLVLEEGN